MPLPHRSIGPFNVSAVILGCMNLNHAYGDSPSEADSVALLNHALDLGCTMLDTASIYGAGRNEELVAKAVGHRRSEFVLSSKCVLYAVGEERRVDGSPGAIREACDGSLARLATDHIDLYHLHRLDPKAPIEDSVGALADLVAAGKIGHIGLSEMSAATIRRAHAVHPIAVVQSEYSPWVRNPEVAVLDVCRELGIGFLAFSPTGRGFLAGAVRDTNYSPGDLRAVMPRFRSPQLEHNLKTYHSFAALAAEAGMAPAQLAIAWTLARAPHIAALPGTRSLTHLEEDLAAANIVLDEDLVAAVDALFVPGAIRGRRYTAEMQSTIDTELLPGEELEPA